MGQLKNSNCDQTKIVKKKLKNLRSDTIEKNNSDKLRQKNKNINFNKT